MNKSELTKLKKDDLVAMHSEIVGSDEIPGTKSGLVEAILAAQAPVEDAPAKEEKPKDRYVAVVVMTKGGLRKNFPYDSYTGKFGETVHNVLYSHARAMEQEGRVKIIG